MLKIFDQILDAGSQYDLPEYLRNRVRPTNIICLLVIFALSIPFVIISLIYFPKMAIFPGAAAIVSMGVIIVNRFGGIYYSRLVLPILLLILSSLYNAYFSTSISDSIVSVYLVELSFTLIPFVVFDFSEKKFLIFCTFFSFLILGAFPFSWQHFDMGYDGAALRTGPLAILTTILAITFQMGCITGLAFINRQSQSRSEGLLNEMNEKNLEVDKSRKQLESNLEQLEKARVVETNRQWAAEGIAQLSHILRSNLEGEQMYDKVIAFIVKYLQANQGGLYVVEKESEATEATIRLSACYAYNRKKYIERSFAPGQGLIGQCYLEGEHIYITDIPSDYIQITSGLGEATPRSLMVIPLKVNETIEGILEIASFNKFNNHEIECLTKLCESIGAFIQSHKINLQTRHFLEISQQQAEEMRASEEEMRQNMEELEATQEEMRRNEGAHLQEITRLEQVYQTNTTVLEKKDMEMSGFLSAVNSTLAMIEFDLQGTILTANERFLEVMGYSLNEIAGNPHRLFVEAAYSQSSAYTTFWQELSAGKAQVGEVKRISKNGKEIWLSASYTPLFNKEKKVVKIIKFAQDITEQKSLSLDSQSQLEAISKSNGIVEFDLDGIILSANDNFLAIMNYERKEIIGTHHRLFVNEKEQLSEEYSDFWDKLRSGEFMTGEFERVAKGGKQVWIKGSYNPIKDNNGKVYKVVKYAQEVTAQKLLELQAIMQTEELQAQEEEIRQNLEQLQASQQEVERKSIDLQAQIAAVDTSLATIEFDLEGNILKANKNFLSLMGYGLEEIVAQPHHIFVEAAYRESKEYRKFWQELKAGKAQIGKVKRFTKEGKQIWLNASYTPVFDLNDQPIKVIKLAQYMEA